MWNNHFGRGGSFHAPVGSAGSHEMSIPLHPDSQGMVGRECPSRHCSPGYFKVNPGSGLSKTQESVFCPYCRATWPGRLFHTDKQLAYARELLAQKTVLGIHRAFRDAIGAGGKTLGGSFLAIRISVSTPVLHASEPPHEEELQREIQCPSCGSEHAVFGVAIWCPASGSDVFLEHVRGEFAVIQIILAAVGTRRAELGARVAAKDTENALEDVVSIFEAVMKIVIRRSLELRNVGPLEVPDRIRSIGNSFQNVESGAREFQKDTGMDLFEDAADKAVLDAAFTKRHPHTHNLSIVDRRYLERVRSGALEGRELRFTSTEVIAAIESAQRVTSCAYKRCIA